MTPEEITSHNEAFEDEFILKVREVNDFCLQYGCFFEVAWLTGSELDGLLAFVRDAQANALDAISTYGIINDWFTAIEYHPFSRAHFIYRAQKTPFFSDFSHHLERGLLSYYKGDFFSAVTVLVPAVEGILRQYVGAGPMVTGKALVSMIPNTQRSALHGLGKRHATFKELLHKFLSEWFFARTNDPRLGIIPSLLSRNYASHLPGSGSFYKPADCNRLFALFDVMLEVVTLEFKDVEQFIGMPREGIPEVETRRDYYAHLMTPWSPWRKIREVEEEFMVQNKDYETEAVPDWAGIIAAKTLEDQQEIEAIIKGEKPETKTRPPEPLKPTPSERQ